MNYACSLLRPIDQKLEECLVEGLMSRRIRLNVERGKEMLNELELRDMDEQFFGFTSDSEIEIEEDSEDIVRKFTK